MKKLFTAMALVVFTHSFAFAETIPADQVENLEVVEATVEEETNVTIKEVKDLVATLPQEATCLDEYLKRRKQMIAKLALVPVTATAAVMGSVYVGGMAAAGISNLANVEGWSALGYVILGATGGAVVSSAYVLYDTTKSTMDTIDNNMMIKMLAEQYLGREGAKTEKLYQKYLKSNPENALSKAELVSKVLELDKTGGLCDGSLVKQPKFKIGFKLKYKVAKSKDIIRSL